ncbi:hypothetical protein DFH11DRAFT_1503211 [Phellopilus nigrolimitatus]|nr:hypothetical protein DFH11DRAFT_1503211 [Phellopilus nigrolimitatus]
MSTSAQYVLLQYGSDPLNFQFEDSEDRLAFTACKVVQVPNLVVQLSRQDEWALQHPDIIGPRNAYFYFGPSNSPGQVAYGNGERVAMSYYLRKKKDASNSRYFFAQNGRELKWKSISSQKMEVSISRLFIHHCLARQNLMLVSQCTFSFQLCDSRSVYAIWEKAPPGSEHDAEVTISHIGLTFVTEVLTTLTLNLAAKRMDFW